MSITVADCLKLPALRDATLVAGAGGINRPVSSVTVMEYPDIPALNDDLVVGNELILSGLIAIRDDVQSQCDLLHCIHSLGAAGLVLYYVGVYIKELSPQLLATAEELDFPIIAMPLGRMDFRYSDVITEVVERVIIDQKQETYYASEMVKRISQLPEQNRTINAVLRLLSDRLRCTLVLADRYLTKKAAAAWPVSNQWEYQQILDSLKEMPVLRDEPVEMLCDRPVFVRTLPVLSKKHLEFHLLALDEQGTQDREGLQQAVEVIEMFLNVWNQDTNYEGTDALVRAVLNDRPDEKQQIAERMHIDVSSIHNIWILHPTNMAGRSIDGNQRLNCLMRLKRFLQEHHKLAIVDYYSQYLVAMTDDNLFDETEMALAEEYTQQLAHNGIQIQGAVCQGIMNTAQAREAYILADENLSTACRIYPEKAMFTLGEIRFSRWCRETVLEGEQRVNREMRCLAKVRELPDGVELLDTLAVYLLDAESNMQKTGNLMFLHKNTVKYRLSKVRSAISCELNQMPESLELYQASGIGRLLKT